MSGPKGGRVPGGAKAPARRLGADERPSRGRSHRVAGGLATRRQSRTASLAASLAAALALALQPGATAQAKRAPTGAAQRSLAGRLEAHLRALARGGVDPADAHWHLAEAGRLASLVPGGVAQLIPAARRVAARAKGPWLQGEALGLVALSGAVPPRQAGALLRQAGLLDRGLILGPLPGPTAPAGEEKLALGREGPAAAHPIPGKRAPISWRAFHDGARSDWSFVPGLLDCHGDCHGYVVHDLVARAPVDAMVVVDTAGPAAAWLDGQPIARWDGARPRGDWQHPTPARLAAGRHRIVVVTGHPTDEPWAAVRVLDRRGRLPGAVRLEAVAPQAPLASWSPSTRLPPPLGSLGGDDPTRRAEMALLAPREEAVRRVAARAAQEAREAHPRDPELAYLQGRAEEADANRARAAFEDACALSAGAAGAHAPAPSASGLAPPCGHIEALAALLEDAENGKLRARADALARALRALAPQHPAGIAHEVMGLLGQAGPESALALLDRLAPQGADPSAPPEAAPAPRLAYLRGSLLESSGRLGEASRVYAGLTRRVRYAAAAARKAVGTALRAGELGAAQRVAREVQEARPYEVWSELLLVEALAAGRDARPGGQGAAPPPGATGEAAARGPLDEAARVAREALELHPDSADLYAALGRTLLLAGDRAGALDAWDRALDLRPQDRALAERRRALAQGRTLAERFGLELEDIVKGAPKLTHPAPEGARYLLDRRVVRVWPSGLSSRLEQRVVRVEAQRATERFQSIPIPFTPGEERLRVVRAEVLHPDGTRSRPRSVVTQRPDGKQQGVYTLTAYRVVQFDALHPGDVVHTLVQRDEVGHRNVFGDFFGFFVPLQDAFPKVRAEVTLVAPTSRRLYADGRGLPPVDRRVEGETQTLTWLLRDLPGVTPEPKMPGLSEVGAYLSVSTYRDWGAMARWYRELARPQLRLSPSLQETVHQLTDGLGTPRAKAAAIQDWVLDHTRYVGIEFGIHGFKPYRVTQVVKRGYGDCKDKASLLVALLGEAGIEADLVLVRTRNLGRLTRTPATLWAFNHAIAYIPSLDTYIDGTSEHAGFGEVPAADQGATILRVDILGDRPPVLTTLPHRPATENLATSDSTAALRPDGSATVRFKETVRGTGALPLRRAFADSSRREEVLEVLVARQHPCASVTASRFSGIEDRQRAVTVEVTATMPGYGKRRWALIEVPLDTAPDELLKTYAGLEKRRYPLLLRSPSMNRSTSRWVFPPGWRPEVPPQARKVDLTSPFGSFQRALTVRGGEVVSEQTLTLSRARIAPEEYPAFRVFLRAIAAASAQVITLHPPAPAPPPQTTRSPHPDGAAVAATGAPRDGGLLDGDEAAAPAVVAPPKPLV